jgi:hypothetical protein
MKTRGLQLQSSRPHLEFLNYQAIPTLDSRRGSLQIVAWTQAGILSYGHARAIYRGYDAYIESTTILSSSLVAGRSDR